MDHHVDPPRPAELDGILRHLESAARRLKWDRRFLERARMVASWSKDPSTKVGAVIVDDRRIVVGEGYNGFPRGVHDDDERYADRELKYKLVVHAEVNAVLAAGERARGATLYIWPSFLPVSDGYPPSCNECCKIVIQAGIREIVGYEPGQLTEAQRERSVRWRPLGEISRLMCGEAGVRWRGVPEHD